LVFTSLLFIISAYQFPISNLKKHFGVISVLGTCGLILTSFLLGVTLVLFSLIIGMLFSDRSFSFLSFISDFFIVSVGGITIGLIFGWIVLKGLHLTNHFQYQVMVSITLAYGSFYLAEQMHMSGVLASVSSGILFSWKLEQSGKESDLRHSLNGF
jgi:CPA1 family monovalent cation:H+ antiporter